MNFDRDNLRLPNQKSRASIVIGHLIKHKELPSLVAREEDRAFEEAVSEFQVICQMILD